MRQLLLVPALLAMSLASAQQERIRGVNVGDMAPEIAMENPDGEILKLSELKGKVVLIDFWASWCRPCRMESPVVRRIHKKYKDELYTNGSGFDIFSVSLDRQGAGEAWKKAIAQDSLTWKYHVGAVKDGNNTASNRYQVMFIPTNALIDGSGKIIAKDIHGQALEHMLDSLIEKDPAKKEALEKQKATELKAQEKAAKKEKKQKKEPALTQ
jgi:thiol-disulfide isomerase/thioredoxin